MCLQNAFVVADDKNDGFDSGGDCFLHRKLNERLASNWEHFLGDGLGRGKHPCAKAGRGNDRLRNSFTVMHSKTPIEEMREENLGRTELCREIGSWSFILLSETARIPSSSQRF